MSTAPRTRATRGATLLFTGNAGLFSAAAARAHDSNVAHFHVFGPDSIWFDLVVVAVSFVAVGLTYWFVLRHANRGDRADESASSLDALLQSALANAAECGTARKASEPAGHRRGRLAGSSRPGPDFPSAFGMSTRKRMPGAVIRHDSSAGGRSRQ